MIRKRLFYILVTSIALLTLFLIAIEWSSRIFQIDVLFRVIESLNVLFYVSIFFFAVIIVTLWMYHLPIQTEMKDHKKLKVLKGCIITGIIGYILVLGSQSNVLYRQVYIEQFIEDAQTTQASTKKLPEIKIIGSVSQDRIEFFIYEGLRNQPTILLEGVEYIILCHNDEFKQLKENLGLDDALAFATSYNNAIYIDASLSSFHRIVTHELAHIYDFKHNSISKSKDFGIIYKQFANNPKRKAFDSIINVEYALTSPSELFAELSDAYYNASNQLYAIDHTIYEYLYKIYKED